VEFTTFAAATNQSLLSKAIKFTGPVGLAVVPLVEAINDGYEVSKHGGNALEIMGSSALGAGKGVVDTYLPSARSGYSDVFGKERVTGFDRFLNAANDGTGTATAVGATALAVEVAGIATIPAAIPTGFITAAAGLSNLGINVVKLGAKVSGIAGKDQDGGYIYDGAALAINGVEHLIGHSSK